MLKVTAYERPTSLEAALIALEQDNSILEMCIRDSYCSATGQFTQR